jgi:DNA polymerase delta subunit 1
MEFQIISWFSADVEDEEDQIDKFVVKLFGRNEDGESVALTVTDFTPYFYVKLLSKWNRRQAATFVEVLSSKMPLRYRDAICDFKIMSKMDFWGFTNKEMFPFMRLCFKSERAMRSAAKVLSTPGSVRVNGIFQKNFKLYESNILPMLRFAHIRNISPCGWVKVSRCLPADLMPSPSSTHDMQANWKHIDGVERADLAPMVVASFDIECMSSDGDFPVARKNYAKIANDMYNMVASKRATWRTDFAKLVVDKLANGDLVPFKKVLLDEIEHTLLANAEHLQLIALGDATIINAAIKDLFSANFDGSVASKLYASFIAFGKKLTTERSVGMRRAVQSWLVKSFEGNKATKSRNCKDDEAVIESITRLFMREKDGIVEVLTQHLDRILPRVKGDEIIQIGVTIHRYGDTECSRRILLSLGSCDAIDGCTVLQCKTETDLLMQWAKTMETVDPDIVTGYNIFGFDFNYIHQRALELGCQDAIAGIGRLQDVRAEFKEARLSSSALGDNTMYFYDMPGRTNIDLMKVVQRDHKLDSYKLDHVAGHFTGMKKNDVTPADIFSLYKGSSADRARIGAYCIQDCELCNKLVMKLEILANNMGMANVCSVPLNFIFMRGQGVKIFSLVAKQCKELGYLIPTKVCNNVTDAEGEDGGYEGAIVLEPETGIYIDTPVAVLDYASLYPSSMISENLSHDCLVVDSKYDNLPGVEYQVVSYDIYEGEGDEKIKVAEKVCRYAHHEKGVIPNILMHLLKQRKVTRKRMAMKVVEFNDGSFVEGYVDGDVLTTEQGDKHKMDTPKSCKDKYNAFQKATLDGLQNAYKVTANSLYGQVGSRTSPIYLKEIAACTTATGRRMIMLAKGFMEKEYNAHVVYGDTDSLFMTFPTGKRGRDALEPTIAIAKEASQKIKPLLQAPHDLEYEKTFWPFILFSKKRYVANQYGNNSTLQKQSSMGIVLKRRDNAQIVKIVYGGIIDIILNHHDINAAVSFLQESLRDLIQGKYGLDDLVVSKTLKAHYKDPSKIAHKVLAERIKERSPGNAPQTNDRIPYVYIFSEAAGKTLQGDRIEHPEYIKDKGLRPDYEFYILNQIMKPVLQVFAIVLEQLDGYNTPAMHWKQVEKKLVDDGKSPKYIKEKIRDLREAEVKKILFDPILLRLSRDPELKKLKNKRNGNRTITEWFSMNAP